MPDALTREHQSRLVRAIPTLDPNLEGRITARVLTYGTVDSYATTFAKGVFTESMQDRMPRIVWSHDWADVIGVWQGYEEDDSGLTLIGQLDLDMIPGTNTPAVPRAHQALAQLRSGSIDQFSVGFWPLDYREVTMDGQEVVEFTRGTLDEASLVMVGAVPGTKLLALRDGKLRDNDGNEYVRTTAVEDDTEDDTEIVEYTDEDLHAWALLAQAGDVDAQAQLTDVLGWLFPDTKVEDFTSVNWSAMVEAALGEEAPAADEEDDIAPPVEDDADDEQDDDGTEASDTDETDTSDTDETVDIDAEMAEALALLSDMA